LPLEKEARMWGAAAKGIGEGVVGSLIVLGLAWSFLDWAAANLNESWLLWRVAYPIAKFVHAAVAFVSGAA